MTPAAPTLSVVVATYNRPDGIVHLLRDLDRQEGFAPGAFEVVVVDDGSKVPVTTLVDPAAFGYPLRLVVQANAGAGAARHRAITLARADLVVILDDDMRVEPGFLAAHRAAHEAGGEVVLGAIVPPDYRLPLFERWQAAQMVRFADEIRDGLTHVRGAHLATGNVSLRRARYDEVGGFDPTLERSEDRDLGIRLERAGARFAFAPDATSVHHTDLAGVGVWLRRCFNYGISDSIIAAKFPDIEYVDPWRFYVVARPARRPLLLLAAVAPSLGSAVRRVAMAAAELAARLGFERLALAGTGFVYGLEYFRGVRAQAGSLGAALAGLREYRRKLARQAPGTVHVTPRSA